MKGGTDSFDQMSLHVFSYTTFISINPGHQCALIDSQRATCLCNHSYRRPIVKSNTLMAASVRGNTHACLFHRLSNLCDATWPCFPPPILGLNKSLISALNIDSPPTTVARRRDRFLHQGRTGRILTGEAITVSQKL